MLKLNPHDFDRIVFFTGAGMSAESGVPTYRGQGGIWAQYNYEEYACQAAFDRDPEKVLRFHELRRRAVLECQPHAGHTVIAELEKSHPSVTVVTQNIDGMHQRAGSKNVLELHGSVWRLRCPDHGVWEDHGEQYKTYHCPNCGEWLRPDIVWFGDMLDEHTVRQSETVITDCDLLISIGTSGIVYPAAGFPQLAKSVGALCVEINPDTTELSFIYDHHLRGKAGEVLVSLFVLEKNGHGDSGTR